VLEVDGHSRGPSRGREADQADKIFLAQPPRSMPSRAEGVVAPTISVRILQPKCYLDKTARLKAALNGPASSSA
jgi:hypothetical protein